MWAGTSHKAAPLPSQTRGGLLLLPQCGSSLETFFWIQTDHPSWFQYTEKITLFCITQHAMELPHFFFFFCTLAYKSSGSAASVRPGRSAAHSDANLNPSTKPSANLLPNSFCYPTITPQAPWIPGTQPVRGTVLNKKDTDVKTHWETGWTFFIASANTKTSTERKAGNKRLRHTSAVCPLQQSCSRLIWTPE